jgi:hypothetical protein
MPVSPVPSVDQLRQTIHGRISIIATGKKDQKPLERTDPDFGQVPDDAAITYRMTYEALQDFILPTRNPVFSPTSQAEAAFILDWCIYAEKTLPRVQFPDDFPGGITIINPHMATWGMAFGEHTYQRDGTPVTMRGYRVQRHTRCTIVFWAMDDSQLAEWLKTAWSRRVSAAVGNRPFWILMQAEAMQRMRPPVIPAEAVVLDDRPSLIPDKEDTRRLERALVLSDDAPSDPTA